MNILKRLVRWAYEDSEETIRPLRDRSIYAKSQGQNAVSSDSANLGDIPNGMNFTVWSAAGGKVIQMRSYNHNTDRHNNALYIIPEKDDLGEELGLIITRESLSR